MNNDKKNLLVTMAITFAIMSFYNWFFPNGFSNNNPPKVEKVVKSGEEILSVTPTLNKKVVTNIKESPRVYLRNDHFKGSISLVGGYLNEAYLLDYKDNLKDDAQAVKLLNPNFTNNPYYVDLGWSADDKDINLPNYETQWAVKDQPSDQEVILEFKSTDGLRFERHIKLDDEYLVRVTDKVINKSKKGFNVAPYGLIARGGKVDLAGYSVVHEGIVGVINDKLQEVSYSDINKKNIMNFDNAKGWFGFTDRYWLTALIPAEGSEYNFRDNNKDGFERYQVDYLGKALELKSGGEAQYTHNVYIGPKKLDILDKYEQSLKIEKFDLAIDFGIFYFLTKPLFSLLMFINKYLSSWGLSILVITVLAKLIFLPIMNKSYRSMAKMKELQGEIEKIKSLYSEDKARLNAGLMDLYKRHNINPLSGCLPMLLPAPIFFALYKVLFVAIELRHAPFYGWIKDLSSPDPTSLFNLFGLIDWTPPAVLMIGAWPLLMGFTMLLQQKMSPSTTMDKTQQNMMMLMPIFFTYLFASFPAGLVIYWTWSNILSIAQQWLIMQMNKK